MSNQNFEFKINGKSNYLIISKPFNTNDLSSEYYYYFDHFKVREVEWKYANNEYQEDETSHNKFVYIKLFEHFSEKHIHYLQEKCKIRYSNLKKILVEIDSMKSLE